MTDEEHIPTPDNSGSSGEQDPATEGEILPSEIPKTLPALHAFAQGLMAYPRRPLGDFGSALAAGYARQLVSDNEDLKRENGGLRQRIDELRELLERERIQSARFLQRESSNRDARTLRNVGNTVGTILTGAGISIPSLSDETSLLGYPIVLIVCGAALLLASWFGPRGTKTANSTKVDDE